MVFKLADLKENIKYKFVDNGFGKNEIRIKTTEGGMIDINGIKQAEPKDMEMTYGNVTFTCQYPSSIVEAAKILDAHYPGWADKIALTELDMEKQNKCILGQTYGWYTNVMKYLFNIDAFEDGKSYYNDKIFGTSSSLDEWKKQITLRVKQPSAKLTFIEAVKELTEGKKLTRPPFGFDYIYVDNSNVLRNTSNNIAASIFTWKNCNDWEIVDESKTPLHRLKQGEKFKYAGKEYTRCSNGPTGIYVLSDEYKIEEFGLSTVVEKVNG